MVVHNTPANLQPLVKSILALSPSEQFHILMLLLQTLLSVTLSEPDSPPHRDPKTVDSALADFWPDDETVDDFLAFTTQQRHHNRLA